jgi:hypothetical protein
MKGLLALVRNGFDCEAPSVCESGIDVTCLGTERFRDESPRNLEEVQSSQKAIVNDEEVAAASLNVAQAFQPLPRNKCGFHWHCRKFEVPRQCEGLTLILGVP